MSHLSPTIARLFSSFFDDVVAPYVAQTFLPDKRRGRKDRPFNRKDFDFFAPSVAELSDLFTVERTGNRLLKHYFDHPRFQSAYLLYFYTHQAFKFFHIFNRSSLKDRLQKSQSILDIGAGPGTASLGLVLSLLACGKKIPPLEFVWVDQNLSIMNHGKALMNALCESWKDSFEALPKISILRADLSGRMNVKGTFNWVLSGHFLNERPKNSTSFAQDLLSKTKAEHFLALEPAARTQAQGLSVLRDQILEDTQWKVISPCLHEERCPLASGRDWCHFSEPVEIPGRWYQNFSDYLGSQRSFLKYSHLWISRVPTFVNIGMRKGKSRVVSDPIQITPKQWKILLCKPNTVGSQMINSGSRPRIYRGDLIESKP